jgi:hypothetical protein
VCVCVCGVSGVYSASCSNNCCVAVVTGARGEAVWRLWQGKGKLNCGYTVVVCGVSGIYPVPLSEAHHIFTSLQDCLK